MMERRTGQDRRAIPKPREKRVNRMLARFATAVTDWAGSTWGFAAAVLVILAWGITGPIFHFSDTWQLVINTGTTIVTFLMVFLIQRSQNKESIAVQLKLNEIVAAIEGASNRLIDVEDLSEAELKTLRHFYQRLADMAEGEEELTKSHSVEDAEALHEYKRERRQQRRRVTEELPTRHAK